MRTQQFIFPTRTEKNGEKKTSWMREAEGSNTLVIENNSPFGENHHPVNYSRILETSGVLRLYVDPKTSEMTTVTLTYSGLRDQIDKFFLRLQRLYSTAKRRVCRTRCSLPASDPLRNEVGFSAQQSSLLSTHTAERHCSGVCLTLK